MTVSFYFLFIDRRKLLPRYNNLPNDVDMLKSTNRNSDQAYDQWERHQNKQKKRLIEQQQQYHQAFKTLSYEEQKDIDPHQAEGTYQ